MMVAPLGGRYFKASWIVRIGPSALRTRKTLYYTLRGFVSLVSMLAWFYGITLVPLATATALNFTSPLFATLGAALVLHESVRMRRWSAFSSSRSGSLIAVFVSYLRRK